MHTAAVRRLTGNAHFSPEFATTWPEYDLDDKTRALLAYAGKLTDSPALVGPDDIARLERAGWSARAIWELSALVALFNMSGRMEAASGLPPDVIPAGAPMPEAARD